jgi:hypothetical protein
MTLSSVLSSASISYRARTVFLGGAPWTPDLTETSRAAAISIHPIRLRVTSNNNGDNNKNNTSTNPVTVLADGDVTHLYDQQDSADTPRMERKTFPEHEFDPH